MIALSFDRSIGANMETYTVRDLRERTGDLVRTCEAGNLAMLTKHGRPLCITVPLDDNLVRYGVARAMAVQLYRAETVTIALAARIAGVRLEQFIDILGSLGIAAIDYDAAELDSELAALD